MSDNLRVVRNNWDCVVSVEVKGKVRYLGSYQLKNRSGEIYSDHIGGAVFLTEADAIKFATQLEQMYNNGLYEQSNGDKIPADIVLSALQIMRDFWKGEEVKGIVRVERVLALEVKSFPMVAKMEKPIGFIYE